MADAVTRGFISYTRDDNDDFDGVVDELKKLLSALYEARTGRRLELFVDRDSIGWGEDWREKIQVSVSRATVFIPVVTLRYFNSQACLDELLAFESTARALGVTELILPVVLFGADQITVDDERPEVRLIAGLNYQKIEAAWEAGYQSSEWRSALSECARQLDAAIGRAEDALAEAATRGTTTAPTTAVVDGSGDSVLDERGIDLMAINTRMDEVTALLDAATAIFEELGEVAENSFGDDLERLSQAQLNARLLAAAQRMKDPAARLESAGVEVETRMVQLDADLRLLLQELASLNLDAAREQLGLLIENLDIDRDEMLDTVEQINEFIETIQFVSLLNVSLRKSLRPAVRGMKGLAGAARIFAAWDNLTPSQ